MSTSSLLYQHCFGNLGAFSNIGTSNRRTGVGTEEVSRREPLSPNRLQRKNKDHLRHKLIVEVGNPAGAVGSARA